MYSFQLKKRMCEEICLEGASTIRTAEKYGVPLKTLEKWITSYHKNPEYFDKENIKERYYISCKNERNFLYEYDKMDKDDLIFQLHLRDIEIEKLKKCNSLNGLKY